MYSQIHWSACLAATRNCGIAIHAPGYYISPDWFYHSLSDFDLWVMLDGTAEIQIDNGGWLPLTRGSCLWLAPGRHYEFRVTGAQKLIMAFAHFDFLAPDGRMLPPAAVAVERLYCQLSDPQFFESSVRRILVIQYLKKGREKEQCLLLDRQISHLMQSMLYAYAAQCASSEPLVQGGMETRHQQVVAEAIAWIHEHPEADCSMQQLASRFGYETRYFCRFFLALTGRTPRQMMIKAKVAQACEFLKRSAMNIGEIAESLGYTNIYYFSRQFRKETGVSPSSYRNAQRKPEKDKDMIH